MAKNICKFTDPVLPAVLTLHCFVLETNWQTMIAPHTLKNHRVLLVVSGKGRIRFDRSESELSPGMLFFAFPGETVSVANPDQLSYLYIDFGNTRAQELLRRFCISKANRSFDNFDGLIPLWQDSLARATERTVDLAAESMLLYTFSRLAGDPTGQNSLLQKLLEQTEDHFRESDFTLSALSEQLSYNPKYLSHFFKQKMHVSYSEYLCTLRLKYAVSLFDHGIDSVKNVALLSGFSDPLYFSQVFKKKLGLSPKEYIGSKKRNEES